MYNLALSSSEIESLYIPVDQIETNDTIIFKGSGLKVRLPISCANSFIWVPGSGVNTPFDQEPVLSPQISTSYQVNMDYGSCVATDSINIIVVDSTQLECESIFLPKAFTPNEDGLNDSYGFSNAVFIGDLQSFEIYDRWGGLIFTTQDPNDAWDGYYKNEAMLPGMYIYKVRFSCNGNDKVSVGSFSLLR
jgi:gliding motility-associated-like protein